MDLISRMGFWILWAIVGFNLINLVGLSIQNQPNQLIILFYFIFLCQQTPYRISAFLGTTELIWNTLPCGILWDAPHIHLWKHWWWSILSIIRSTLPPMDYIKFIFCLKGTATGLSLMALLLINTRLTKSFIELHLLKSGICKKR